MTDPLALIRAALEAAAKACDDDVPSWAKDVGQVGPGNLLAEVVRALDPAEILALGAQKETDK